MAFDVVVIVVKATLPSEPMLERIMLCRVLEMPETVNRTLRVSMDLEPLRRKVAIMRWALRDTEQQERSAFRRTNLEDKEKRQVLSGETLERAHSTVKGIQFGKNIFKRSTSIFAIPPAMEAKDAR